MTPFGKHNANMQMEKDKKYKPNLLHEIEKIESENYDVIILKLMNLQSSE